MKVENKIKCNTINVDCVVNDPVDVRRGGPEYLGFDFFVREEQTNETMAFIIDTLTNYEIPILNIKISDTLYLNNNEVWTKEKITKCICDNAEYLKEQY